MMKTREQVIDSVKYEVDELRIHLKLLEDWSNQHKKLPWEVAAAIVKQIEFYRCDINARVSNLEKIYGVTV